MARKLKTLYFCVLCDVRDNFYTVKFRDVEKWIKQQDSATFEKYYGEGDLAYIGEVMELDWNSTKHFITDRVQINGNWIYFEDLDSSVE